MKPGDKVVCHIEGTVDDVSEWGTVTIVTSTGDTWSIEADDPDWKVVDAS